MTTGTYDRWYDCSRSFSGSRRGRAGAYKEAFGRSRCGFTTKVHALTDGQEHPLGFVFTGTEAWDYNAVEDLMSIRVKKPRLLLADKCYDGDNVRDALLCSGIKPVIAPKENRKNLQPATPSPTRVETASSGC
ncbi:transposase [Brucella sp. TWI432]